MKNSAWYHKFWLKKLTELPLKEDADTAWAGMKDMLDAQLPVGKPGGHGGTGTSAAKPFFAKLVSLAGYALPVAAAIGVTTYFITPLIIKPSAVKKKQSTYSLADTDSISKNSPSVFPDSLKDTVFVKNDTLNFAKNDTLNNNPSAIAGKTTGLVTEHVPVSKTGDVTDKMEDRAGKIVYSAGKTGTASKTSAVNMAGTLSKTHSMTNKQSQTAQLINRTDQQRSLTADHIAAKNRRTETYSATGKPFKAASGSFSSVSASGLKTAGDTTAKIAGVIDASSASRSVLLVNPGLTIGPDKSLKNLLTGYKTIDQLIINKQNNNALNAKKPTAKKSAVKTLLSKKSRPDRTKTTEKMITPVYDFGLEGGWNTSKSNSLYLGVFGSYRIRQRLLLNAGIRLNTATTISGNYTTKPGSFLGDTVYHYKVSDNRKLMVLNIPLTVEYRLSNRISVNAGPVISFPLSQSNIKSKSEFLGDTVLSNKLLDTVRHRSVDSTLTHAKLNRINLGITGGVSFRFRQFYIEAKYLQNLNPYRITSALGGYQQSYGSFQLGIRYKFKK